MKTIVKISFVCLAALAFSSVSAQNALSKRNIKKAESTSVKSNASSVDAKVTSGIISTTPVEREEKNSTFTQVAPAQVKSGSSTQSKSPAQMSNKPLQKKSVVQRKVVSADESVK